ncbi:hypothetical protein TeGR_g8936 [Tetraparma gracilis]|uniref:Methyltransferase domain-containing protein n=1 Tax=Tetraparma gracilis TaxID=2962635 RepID=A0ABQ6M3Y3_9STRA|nr:hypothetical protein TeGR_g8936 [Tetraparma gracilis]
MCLCAEGTLKDEHTFSSEEMSPEKLVEKYPELLDIMNEVQSPMIPLDLVIAEFPELWQRMKDDPPVWAWFKVNMPHYTVDRAEGATSTAEKPFSAPSPELQLLIDIEQKLLHEHGGSTKKAARAPVPTGDAAATLYSHWQVLKWSWKNWVRATGKANGPARAWESHKVDRDYPRWLEKYGVPPGSRVLDIGTEMGLQSISLAKLGYSVMGTDVGSAELDVAREYAIREGDAVNKRTDFLRDDILDGANSKLVNGTFDVVFDRAVYHSMMPYLHAEPRLRRAVDARFSNRIKALLKPGGIFVFKGMSDEEEGFRPQEASKSFELNPLVAFEFTQLLMHTYGGVQDAIRSLIQSGLVDVGQEAGGPEKMLQQMLQAMDGKGGGRFAASKMIFDLHHHPMPHHFTEFEMTDIFRDRMCFDILEGGNSRFFNDKAKDEQMPKVRYVVLKNSGKQCPGAAADNEPQGEQSSGGAAVGEEGNVVELEEADRKARVRSAVVAIAVAAAALLAAAYRAITAGAGGAKKFAKKKKNKHA